MKKPTLTIILCIIHLINMQAQKVSPFELIMPDTVVEKSLYNKIECLDELSDRPGFGYITTTIFSARSLVVDQVPIQIQLDTLMRRITDETAQNNTILLQLRDLDFAKGDPDRLICHIRLNLYEKLDSGYGFINRLDTTVANKPKEIINEASFAITDFIIQNLKNEPLAGLPYSLDDIHHVDLVEKENIPFYRDTDYKDGIYYTYSSLANQKPDVEKMQVKIKSNVLKDIEIFDAGKGTWIKTKPDNIYSVVVNGKIYAEFDKNYYPVYKNGDNFMFVVEKSAGSLVIPTGDVSISKSGYGTAVGGGIGIAIGPKPKEKIIYMIDHINGSFIFTGKMQ